ncbi:MAG TPA: arginine deiminase-related protein, partial [Chitinophagaceae bacterium]|nr:arginine deiminase-related protein [Chitinophagaceae bacterium]
MQITDTILMIRPAAFGPNEETASTNFFQSSSANINLEELQQTALSEFDEMVELLKRQDINVLVIEDTPAPAKP